MIGKLVIASHNRKKAAEMIMILEARFPSLEIRTLADYPGAPEPDETGETYAENAVIKAKSAAEFTHEWCLADDAGLEIDALEGAPGLLSRRYGGEEMSFPNKMAMILEQMRDVPKAQRAARFRCSVALTSPEANEDPRLFEAICEGRIARFPTGVGGFGYDPIFVVPDIGHTMAEISQSHKNLISHRGKVLRMVGDYLCLDPSTVQ
jgi:XTP/dITP diphosphohydrolase